MYRLFAFVIPLVFALPTLAAELGKHPNIVWIIVDDMSAFSPGSAVTVSFHCIALHTVTFHCTLHMCNAMKRNVESGVERGVRMSSFLQQLLTRFLQGSRATPVLRNPTFVESTNFCGINVLFWRNYCRP